MNIAESAVQFIGQLYVIGILVAIAIVICMLLFGSSEEELQREKDIRHMAEIEEFRNDFD